jgi:hypothetical protein
MINTTFYGCKSRVTHPHLDAQLTHARISSVPDVDEVVFIRTETGSRQYEVIERRWSISEYGTVSIDIRMREIEE